MSNLCPTPQVLSAKLHQAFNARKSLATVRYEAVTSGVSVNFYRYYLNDCNQKDHEIAFSFSSHDFSKEILENLTNTIVGALNNSLRKQQEIDAVKVEKIFTSPIIVEEQAVPSTQTR